MFVVSAVAFLVALVLLFAAGQCENSCGTVVTPALILAVTVGVIAGFIALRLVGTDDDSGGG